MKNDDVDLRAHIGRGCCCCGGGGNAHLQVFNEQSPDFTHEVVEVKINEQGRTLFEGAAGRNPQALGSVHWVYKGKECTQSRHLTQRTLGPQRTRYKSLAC